VSAVITMLAVGEGAQRTVLKEIEGMGLRNIILDSVQPPEASRQKPTDQRTRTLLRYGITRKDSERLRACFPSASLSSAHLVRQKVYRGSMRLDARVLGVTPEYFGLFESAVVSGRGLSAIDERQGHPVALLSEPVAASVRAAGGTLGQTVKIGQTYFEVVGVIRMPSRLSAGMVFIPSSTARRRFGTVSVKREAGSFEWTRNEVGQIVLRFPDERLIPESARVVERLLGENHGAADVEVTVPLDLLERKQRTQRVFNLVLIAIAAISLLVGGIGIMNIMLAVVTERIPEIGVRRAIGASRRDILLQFLAETVVLSSAGGIVGCLLGLAAAPLISRLTGWPGIITPGAVVLALAVSWLVGVVFGLAPAVQAARLNPVECLRYE
jgi:putative ABC transport system permease protein